MIGGSFGLREFASVRYEYRKSSVVSLFFFYSYFYYSNYSTSKTNTNTKHSSKEKNYDWQILTVCETSSGELCLSTSSRCLGDKRQVVTLKVV